MFERLEDPETEGSHSHSGLDSNISELTYAPGCGSGVQLEIEDEPVQRRVFRKTFPVSKVPNVVIIFLPQKPTEVFAKKKNFVLGASQKNLLDFLTAETEDKEIKILPVESSESRKLEGEVIKTDL